MNAERAGAGVDAEGMIIPIRMKGGTPQRLGQQAPLQGDIAAADDAKDLVATPRQGAVIEDDVAAVIKRDAVEVIGTVRAFDALLPVAAKGVLVAKPEADVANDDIVGVAAFQGAATQADAHAGSIAAVNGEKGLHHPDGVLEFDGSSHTEFDDAGARLIDRPAEGAFGGILQVVIQPGDFESATATPATCLRTESEGPGEGCGCPCGAGADQEHREKEPFHQRTVTAAGVRGYHGFEGRAANPIRVDKTGGRQRFRAHYPAMRFSIPFVIVLAACLSAVAQTQPNVLIFYLDDMGYAQPGCYGGKVVPTPNMDALAAGGVRFTDGYVSACVCSPSRVGLMTGRYQARTGHDANPNRPGTELLLSETTMAQRMKAAGYATGIVGKWHLGDTGPEYLPAARGFDEAIGSTGNLGEGKGPEFYRGKEMIGELPGAPVTSPVYARESIQFIEKQKDKPWFLYLAFNAVHSPHVASQKWLDKFKDLPKRDAAYAALVAEADEAIGTVMARLRELKQEENTLVFLISDNGGAAPQAEMGGLRGRKWLCWEGGIRVSWLAAWKGRIPPGRVSKEPVIQLDVLPTMLAAAGAEVKADWQLDGVNLLPLLEGKVDKLAPRELYFRFGVQYAVRQGDWKLVKAASEMQPMLVNLASDPGEQTDLTAQQPEKAKALQALFDKWNASMQPPRWEDRRWNGEDARATQKKAKKVRRKEAK